MQQETYFGTLVFVVCAFFPSNTIRNQSKWLTSSALWSFDWWPEREGPRHMHSCVPRLCSGMFFLCSGSFPGSSLRKERYRWHFYSLQKHTAWMYAGNLKVTYIVRHSQTILLLSSDLDDNWSRFWSGCWTWAISLPCTECPPEAV